ncbi:hypothetical protein EDC94DRAFT_655030 [Helicostylum pulchrum]|nr:hypothetical protein EDC94DRAFT_655030 [Helicostylum pulchrum]
MSKDIKEEEQTGSVNISTIFVKLTNLILEELTSAAENADFDLNNFKSNWNRRVNNSTKDLNLINNFGGLFHPPESSSSKSNTDLALFKSTYENIKDKLMLTSGTCVEDVMFEIAHKFSYEHPSHSFIFSDGDVWEDSFSIEDLNEIKSKSKIEEFTKEMPQKLVDTLLKLEQVENVQRHSYSSQGRRSARRGLRILRTNATSSKVSSQAKNKNRLLGSNTMIGRQVSGDHTDLTFMRNSTELGCIEDSVEIETIGLIISGMLDII